MRTMFLQICGIDFREGEVPHGRQPVRAISANSQHKEEAWEFISQFLTEEYQENRKGTDGIWPIGLPIRRSALEKQLQEAMEVSYVTGAEGESIPEVKYQVNLGEGEFVDIYAISAKDAEQLMNLITTASLSDAFDTNILDILWEESDGYFNGECSMDEAIDRMQRRVALYVSERTG